MNTQYGLVFLTSGRSFSDYMSRMSPKDASTIDSSCLMGCDHAFIYENDLNNATAALGLLRVFSNLKSYIPPEKILDSEART